MRLRRKVLGIRYKVLAFFVTRCFILGWVAFVCFC